MKSRYYWKLGGKERKGVKTEKNETLRNKRISQLQKKLYIASNNTDRTKAISKESSMCHQNMVSLN